MKAVTCTRLFGVSRHLLLLLTCLSAWCTALPGQSLKLIFAGDIMVHDGQLRAARQADGSYDFSSSFRYVAPLLQEADLAIGNLELTLPGHKPYAGYPLFRTPDTLAGTLKEAGFDVLVTANNHANDSGRRGIWRTLDALAKRNLHYTGTFADTLERDTTYPLLLQHQGYRLALLNYTYGTNDPHVPAPCFINVIDTIRIKQDLAKARRLNPDLIIAYMHWGQEYHLDENEDQHQLAHQLFQWGADVIIGAHPHVIQPVRILHDYREGKLRRGLVAYSLGNFISGQIKANTDLGLLLEIDLQRHPITKAVAFRHHYIPIWRHRGYTATGRRTYTIIPVSAFAQKGQEALSFHDWRAMLTVTRRLRKHLRRFNSSERVVSLSAWKNEKIP